MAKKSFGASSDTGIGTTSMARATALHPHAPRSFLTAICDVFTLAFIAATFLAPLARSNISSFNPLAIALARSLGTEWKTVVRTEEAFSPAFT